MNFKLNSLFILFATTIASGVSASSSLKLFSSRALVGRQTIDPSEVPSQCTSICAPSLSDVQRCGSQNANCLCTSSVRNNLVNCADCIIGVYPSLTDSFQTVADEDVATCSQIGSPVDPIKLSGTTPGSKSSAASGTLGMSTLEFTAASVVGAMVVLSWL